MLTGLERECRKTVASLRPPEKKKFNGDTEEHDYETVKKGFKRATNQLGITDEIKISELQYWFSGVALGYIELHSLEEDPANQLELIWYELDGKYGKKTNSVDNLLQKIIDGPEVKSGDQKAIDLFTIELKKFDIIATKTDRRKILDSADTINRIIRKRMPSAVPRWAKRIDQALDRDEDDDTALSFKKFIKFVTKEGSYTETLKIIKGKPDSKKNPPATETINAMAAPFEKCGGGGGSGGDGGQKKFGSGKTSFNAPRDEPPPVQPQQHQKKSFRDTNQHTTTEWSCDLCQDISFHMLDSCNGFLEADINEKYNIIRRYGHCYLCFSKDHIAVDCDLEGTRCSICEKSHHTLLHRGLSEQ